MVKAYYEKNVATGQETLYYWLGGRLVAVKRGGTLSYVHQDHLGSTAVMTDTAGNTGGSLGYFPYGSNRSSTGTAPTERKFTGQRLDSGTGLYYYGARYYGGPTIWEISRPRRRAIQDRGVCGRVRLPPASTINTAAPPPAQAALRL